MTTVKTGATFNPDEICIGYNDDVPVFVRRDSPEGQQAVEREREAAATKAMRDAARDMYEALVEAERCIEDAQQEFDCKWSGLHQVRAALARARGDAPSSKADDA